MKNKMIQIIMKASCCLALVATVLNVNAACGFIMHQPKIPASALRFKKQ